MKSRAGHLAISVIIPTLARAERAAHLRRAVASVLEQNSVRTAALVIANGPGVDEKLVSEIQAHPGVCLQRLDRADLPDALRAGRRLVDTPFFVELDDDDVLFPDALARRLDAIQADGGYDVVVSNGVVRGDGPDRPFCTDMPVVARDPLAALGRKNWLSPGGALFRSEGVPSSLLEGLPRYLEWTWLAVRLATECRLRFLDESTFAYHARSPLSTVGSPAYIRGQPDALRAILALDLPKGLRRQFARRLASACNAVAQFELGAGCRHDAWNWHWRCLRAPGGWRYLPFTRRLLFAAGARSALQ